MSAIPRQSPLIPRLALQVRPTLVWMGSCKFVPGKVSQNPEQLGELEREEGPWVAAYGWQEVALAGEWAGIALERPFGPCPL